MYKLSLKLKLFTFWFLGSEPKGRQNDPRVNNTNVPGIMFAFTLYLNVISLFYSRSQIPESYNP
jgi:hypothetical protein